MSDIAHPTVRRSWAFSFLLDSQEANLETGADVHGQLKLQAGKKEKNETNMIVEKGTLSKVMVQFFQTLVKEQSNKMTIESFLIDLVGCTCNDQLATQPPLFTNCTQIQWALLTLFY